MILMRMALLLSSVNRVMLLVYLLPRMYRIGGDQLA